MNEWLGQAWAVLPAVVHVGAAMAVTVDAVLRKRRVSAVIGWIGLAWLAPVVGSLLYLTFGINRIQRSAVALGLRELWSHDAQHPPILRANYQHVATGIEDHMLRHTAEQQVLPPGLAVFAHDDQIGLKRVCFCTRDRFLARPDCGPRAGGVAGRNAWRVACSAARRAGGAAGLGVAGP